MGQALDMTDAVACLKETGVTKSQVRSWINRKVIDGFDGGGKQGVTRTFTKMQTLGLLIAGTMHQSPRSCALRYLAKVFRVFGKIDEKEVVKRIATEDRYLLYVDDDRVIWDNKPNPDGIDLRAMYEVVDRRYGQMESEA